MDRDQLQTLIKTLTDAILTKGDQPDVQLDKTTSIQTFETFDIEKEQFSQYLERFQNYLALKGLKDNDKLCAQLFINSIGSSTYSLLSTLAAPRKVTVLTFKEISDLLNDHFNPKKNIMVERHHFLSCVQGEHQNLTEYIASLRKYINTCNFKCTCEMSIAEIFLSSQFIRGIQDNNIREQLLMTPDLTFNQMVEKALALEASKLDAVKISNSRISNGDDINYVSGQNTGTKPNRFPKPTRRTNREHKSKLDFKELGIEDLCLRCGRDNHLTADCQVNYRKLLCSACKRVGHVQRVCIKTLLKPSKDIKQIYCQSENSISLDDCDSIHSFYQSNVVVEIHSSDPSTKKYYIDVLLEGNPQRFEVDSGAGLTLLPLKCFEKLQLKAQIKPTPVRFRSYTAGVFEPLGVAEVQVTCNNRVAMENVYIVPNQYSPLFGRSWIRKFDIELGKIDRNPETPVHDVKSFNPTSVIQDIEQKYSDLFVPEIGCIPHMTCSLQLRENAKPVFLKDRPVPFALREKVEKELDDLERTGIITKIDYSDWGSPLVVIPKPDGTVRLCVDYKNTLNPQLKESHYPIPRIDDVLNELRDAEYFCTLDLYKAYLHVRVDEDSAILQTISTHRGAYKMNRLSFGVKTAPADFHRILFQAMAGLEGVAKYFDDLTVYGTSFEDCYKKLIALLDRLRTFNIHINRKKCQFFKKEINYLGYVVRKNTILKSPNKVQAILDLPRPQNKEELRRFLGMTTHYSKFIPNISSITHPLRELLKKNKCFAWTSPCETSFMKLKEEISSDRVLVPFNPDLPVTVTCDASPTGIAGVLSHSINGVERPVAFVSRSLSKAEQNYSQLDREALAIVFTLDKFFNFLFGRTFTLISDNRPLTRIFRPDGKLPSMTSARLLRYAIFLQGFNYKIQHRKAEELVHVDCLSRSTIQASTWSKDMSMHYEIRDLNDQTINQITTAQLTYEHLSQATTTDPELQTIISDLQSGKTADPEYSIQGNILFKGNRVVVPKTIQPLALQELHRTHVGIVKMKQLARRYCWWKSVDKDIEELVKSCPECFQVKKSPTKAPIHHWDEPLDNFQRVHIDYAGPLEGHHLLVLVDAKSKWPEVRISKSAPTSESTMALLTDIFSFHGTPQILVSDNATIFTSTDFSQFCSKNGIIQKFIAPGHPATNGLAERQIQTLKNKLTTMRSTGQSLKTRVQEILYRYRATPKANNRTPAEMYLGRNIRIQLDALFPPQQPPISNQHLHLKVRTLSVGERVQARWYTPQKDTWKLGTVIKKFGKLHYQIKLDNGYELKRHIDQLRTSLVPKMTNDDKKTAPVTRDKVPEKPRDKVPEKPRIELIVVSRDHTRRHELAANLPAPQQPLNPTNSPPPVARHPEEDIIRRPQRNRKQPSWLQDYIP